MAVLVTFSFTIADSELTQKERDDAIRYGKETLVYLQNEINGLSADQLKWKPNDSTWSVSDCVEHLAHSEKNIFDWAMGTLQADANPEKRKEIKMDDAAVKSLITDRSFRVKTREGFIPSGEFGDASGAFKVLKERREKTMNYISDTKDDLRNHFGELPFGLIDTYQLMLFMYGHTVRHTDQIKELKSMRGFPKK